MRHKLKLSILAIFCTLAIFYFIKHHDTFYPYKILNKLTSSILWATFLGIIVSEISVRITGHPESFSYKVNNTFWRNGMYYTHQVTRYEDIDLTEEEKERNSYIRDFFKICSLPIGVYLFSSNSPVENPDFSLEKWHLVLFRYTLYPLVISFAFSLILYFIFKILGKDRKNSWQIINKWLSILWKIAKVNVLFLTLWFWIVKLFFTS